MSDEFDLTTNYGLIKPWDGLDFDLWGDHVNQNSDLIDNLIKTQRDALALAIPVAQMGVPLGVATLDAAGKLVSAQWPASATGTPNLKGIWNPVTNTPALGSGGAGGVGNDYYVVSPSGTSVAIDGITTWTAGDWILNVLGPPHVWTRVAISSGFGTMAQQNATAVTITGGSVTGLTQIGLIDGSGMGPSTAAPVLQILDATGVSFGDVTAAGLLRFSGLQLPAYMQTSPFPIYDSVGALAASVGRSVSWISGNTFNDDPSVMWSVRDQLGLDYGYLDPVTGIWAFGSVVPSILNVPGAAGWTSLHADASVRVVLGNTKMDGLAYPNAPLLGVVDDTGAVIVVVDQNGLPGPQYAGGGGGGGGGGGTSYGADDIGWRDAAGVAQGASAFNLGNPNVCRLTFKYNHLVGYGQSLMVGTAGIPALSTTAKHGNLMVGDNVQGNANAQTNLWDPLDTTTLTPLIATVMNSPPPHNIPPSEQATTPPGTTLPGENLLVSACNLLKKWWNQDLSISEDTTRLLVANSAAIGGETIAALSKGASPEIYNRLPQLCDDAQTAVTAAGGGTYGWPLVLFAQGYQDEVGSTTKASYKSLFIQLYHDFCTDVITAKLAQTYPPAMLMSQTIPGGNPFTDANQMPILNAQWELGTDSVGTPWCYLIGTDYPYPGLLGLGANLPHLTSNGYRWQGAMFGKVAHYVMQGKGWRPLEPIQATCRGVEVLINFSVPFPPLVWDTPYCATRVAQTWPDKGFAVYDSGGQNSVIDAEITGQATVLLTLARPSVTNGTVRVQYANAAHIGGQLRDSDPAVSEDIYTYTPGSGQDASENIVALVGKPYPLWNWCICFDIPAVYDGS